MATSRDVCCAAEVGREVWSGLAIAEHVLHSEADPWGGDAPGAFEASDFPCLKLEFARFDPGGDDEEGFSHRARGFWR